MRLFILIVIGLVVAIMVYVRLAPDDVARVHVQGDPRPAGDYPVAGGFTAVRQITASPADVLQVVAQAAMDDAGTTPLAGTVDEGMMTFISRSKVFGFPDYTTVSIIPPETVENAGPLLMISGHLRYGKFDMGVNNARVERWLSALGPLTVPLDQDTSAQ
jgi:hypothetical protein